ncbi:zinc finger protein 703-A-like [Narcine bancroftii]|uniref:zinc finger protein 703-A-like n=1 Tax=Narcine bancroftii TaxID=1343680 RepID=UPI003831AE8B
MRQSARGAGAEPGRSDSEQAERSLQSPEAGAQARRLPVSALSMLSAHILHSDYMQPVSATPLSPIELDAKKSPLALLAQTCSQIGKPDPQPTSKLGLVTPSEKDSPRPSTCLKLGEAALEDKSSFKPYSKLGEAKDASEKAGFRLPGGSSQAFPARPPSLPTVSSPALGEVKAGEKEEKKEAEAKVCRNHSPSEPTHCRPASEITHHRDTPTGAKGEAAASLVPGHVAPVSPYKPGPSVYPLPPSSMGYHGSIVGAYSSAYPSQFIGGVEPKSGLVGSPLSGAVGCPVPAGKSANSSPLTGASPPSFIQGLCRDPYCLAYHSASHLGGNCSSCLHDQPSLKTGYPLVYSPHPLHSSVLGTSSTPPLGTHPLYTYGFMLHGDPRPHVCNWVSAGGPCDKRFGTSEELLGHLRTHTALPGAEKLLAHYPSPASCGLHLPQGPPGSPNGLALRSPHTLALGRYHPYSKNHLATPTSSVLSMSAASPYYSPYALYGQQLTSASTLGYQ